jgi:hypothetical protein
MTFALIFAALVLMYLCVNPKYREIRKAFIAKKVVECKQVRTTNTDIPIMKFHYGLCCPFCASVFRARLIRICMRQDRPQCTHLKASHTHHHCRGCDNVWLERLAEYD